MTRAVVHKSIRRRGAPEKNRNAVKAFVPPDWLKLDSPEATLRFIREILIPAILSGRVGTRAANAVNTSLKILLDYDSDIRHLKEIEEGLDRMEEGMKELDRKLQEHRATTKSVGETNGHDTLEAGAS